MRRAPAAEQVIICWHRQRQRSSQRAQQPKASRISRGRAAGCGRVRRFPWSSPRKGVHPLMLKRTAKLGFSASMHCFPCPRHAMSPFSDIVEPVLSCVCLQVVAAELNNAGSKEIVMFIIRVADDSGEWSVARRFRNFETLHRAMRGCAIWHGKRRLLLRTASVIQQADVAGSRVQQSCQGPDTRPSYGILSAHHLCIVARFRGDVFLAGTLLTGCGCRRSAYSSTAPASTSWRSAASSWMSTCARCLATPTSAVRCPAWD